LGNDNKSSESEVWGILSTILAFVGVLVLLLWWISSTALEGFQSSRNSDSDATRIYAVFDRATVNYWTKDRLDALKVKYGTEIAEPLIEEWTREYLDVSYVRYRQGVAVNPLSGQVYIYSSSSTRKARVETPVKSTRYVYSWIVPVSTYRDEYSLSENGRAECEVIPPSGEVEKFVFSATYSDYDNTYNICAFSGYSGVRVTSKDMGVSKIRFKLHNLVSGKRYLLGSLEFIADDSGERDCSIDIPNYGLRSYLFNEDSSYRVLLHSMDDSGALKEELAFDVSLGDIDWKR
jgi:hypothetical protein